MRELVVVNAVVLIKDIYAIDIDKHIKIFHDRQYILKVFYEKTIHIKKTLRFGPIWTLVSGQLKFSYGK